MSMLKDEAGLQTQQPETHEIQKVFRRSLPRGPGGAKVRFKVGHVVLAVILISLLLWWGVFALLKALL